MSYGVMFMFIAAAWALIGIGFYLDYLMDKIINEMERRGNEGNRDD